MEVKYSPYGWISVRRSLGQLSVGRSLRGVSEMRRYRTRLRHSSSIEIDGLSQVEVRARDFLSRMCCGRSSFSTLVCGLESLCSPFGYCKLCPHVRPDWVPIFKLSKERVGSSYGGMGDWWNTKNVQILGSRPLFLEQAIVEDKPGIWESSPLSSYRPVPSFRHLHRLLSIYLSVCRFIFSSLPSHLLHCHLPPPLTWLMVQHTQCSLPAFLQPAFSSHSLPQSTTHPVPPSSFQIFQRRDSTQLAQVVAPLLFESVGLTFWDTSVVVQSVCPGGERERERESRSISSPFCHNCRQPCIRGLYKWKCQIRSRTSSGRVETWGKAQQYWAVTARCTPSQAPDHDLLSVKERVEWVRSSFDRMPPPSSTTTHTRERTAVVERGVTQHTASWSPTPYPRGLTVSAMIIAGGRIKRSVRLRMQIRDLPFCRKWEMIVSSAAREVHTNGPETEAWRCSLGRTWILRPPCSIGPDLIMYSS